MASKSPVAEEATLELFRNAFRLHAGGVVVFTMKNEAAQPIGFTATSLASLSAVPARATFNMIKSSSSYHAITLGRRVAVNFLSADAHHLGTRFAGPAEQRFAGDHWHEEDGIPVLNDASVVLITDITRIYDQGDNAIIVLNIERGAIREEHEPLLYYNRGYGTIAPVSA